ncbi:MAG: flagellin [Myxococcota bacterium]
MLTISTNVPSLNAQRTLAKNQMALNQSFQRLSTGLRINGAKDDAAGLSISNKMTAQVRGLNQAVRNANNASSLVRTAEAALNEQQDMLQRLRELAVQSASDTNTAQDRTAIQTEANALISEIDRIALQTTFNGRTLLDGSLSNIQFHVGAFEDQAVGLTVKGSRSFNLGSVYTADITANTVASVNGDLTLNGVSIDGTAATDDSLSPAADADHSAIALATVINEKSADTGVTAEVNANVLTGVAGAGGALTIDFEINGASISIVAAVGTQANDADSTVRNAINAVSGSTGVVATLGASNQLVLTAQDGRNIVTTNLSSAEAADIGLGGSDSVNIGTVTLKSDEAITAGTSGTITNVITGGAAGALGALRATNLETLAFGTQAGANTAIDLIDDAIFQVSDRQSELGAVLNRMDAAVSQLSTASENLSAAQSQIRDADFAAETAAFSKNQILQQASSAMLAQANVANQIALTLLG